MFSANCRVQKGCDSLATEPCSFPHTNLYATTNIHQYQAFHLPPKSLPSKRLKLQSGLCTNLGVAVQCLTKQSTSRPNLKPRAFCTLIENQTLSLIRSSVIEAQCLDGKKIYKFTNQSISHTLFRKIVLNVFILQRKKMYSNICDNIPKRIRMK